MKIRHYLFLVIGFLVLLIHWPIVQNIRNGEGIWHPALLLAVNVAVESAGLGFIAAALGPFAIVSRLKREAYARAIVIIIIAVTTLTGAAEVILNGQRVDELIRDLESKNPAVRIAAVPRLAVPAYEKAVPALIAALKDSETQVRVLAARALGESQARSAAGPLAAALDDVSPEVRTSALEALETLWDTRSENSFIPDVVKAFEREQAAARLLRSRLQAIEERLSARDRLWSYVPFSESEFRDQRDHDSTRGCIARLLVKMKSDQAIPALIQALAERDLVVVAAAYPFFVKRGDPGSESTLVAALEAHGSKEMAQAYLNCGNPLLADSAKQWATGNGYEIVSRTSGESLRWGSTR